MKALFVLMSLVAVFNGCCTEKSTYRDPEDSLKFEATNAYYIDENETTELNVTLYVSEAE